MGNKFPKLASDIIVKYVSLMTNEETREHLDLWKEIGLGENLAVSTLTGYGHCWEQI